MQPTDELGYVVTCFKTCSKLYIIDALGSIVGFSQYTANFIHVYIYSMSRGRHVSASLILGHLQVHRTLCSLQCQAPSIARSKVINGPEDGLK